MEGGGHPFYLGSLIFQRFQAVALAMVCKALQISLYAA